MNKIKPAACLKNFGGFNSTRWFSKDGPPAPKPISKFLREDCIIPDMIPYPPRCEAKICYRGIQFAPGIVIEPANVQEMPSVKYDGCEPDLFTVMLVDPDSPCRAKPEYALWLHWLVGNIPGNNICRGDHRFEYVPAAPPPNTGLHRYVFFVFKQYEKNCYKDEAVPRTCAEGRNNFCLPRYHEKYNLGELMAVNYFKAKFDCSVVETYKALGIEF